MLLGFNSKHNIVYIKSITLHNQERRKSEPFLCLYHACNHLNFSKKFQIRIFNFSQFQYKLSIQTSSLSFTETIPIVIPQNLPILFLLFTFKSKHKARKYFHTIKMKEL